MSMKEEAIRTLVEGSDVPAPFVPGESPVPVSGKVVGAREKTLMIEAALDGWLTAGRFSEQFEREFATRTSRQKAFLVNSGSSAKSARRGRALLAPPEGTPPQAR
jgi:Predicted pyridoxal phosphate-dependent enzyme apparently involved in regulation of cell wall biogenesis